MQQIVDVLVLVVVMEKIAQSIKSISQERIRQRTDEEIMDDPARSSRKWCENESWSRLLMFQCSRFKDDLRKCFPSSHKSACNSEL